MSTLYELFKVKENATLDEITEAYHRILKKADSLPQNQEIIEQVRRLKIAYGILSDPEKRKKYDLDLATRRADELLENVQIKKEETEANQPNSNSLPQQDRIKERQTYFKNNSLNEERVRQTISEQINRMAESSDREKTPDDKEQKLAEKEKRKQLKKAKRKAKKEQQLKREMEIQAYGKYLENQGYKVKYPWTWPRVKRFIITLITLIISCIILWHIPFVKESLIDLYNSNFVIKFLIDIVLSIFKGLIDLIKWW